MRLLLSFMFLYFVMGSTTFAQTLKCDMTQYKQSPGLTAVVEKDQLVVTWMGRADEQLCARFAIELGQPVIRELAIRKKAAPWTVLGQNLMPEYQRPIKAGG